MADDFLARAEIVIKASPPEVWEALTDPKMIKQYLYGTETQTDWKEGSPITWKGEWQGKTYEDKGEVLRVEKEKVLEMTYWSGMSGKEDKPENYVRVKFELEPEGEETRLTITQTADTEESRDHSEKNWQGVLDSIKKLLENA